MTKVPASKSDVGATREMSEERKSSLNFGTIVFATFSFLSLVVCFVKGIVPIYAMESVMWGALAWYCYRKSPLGRKANLIVLLLAVAVAGGEGYSVGVYSVRKEGAVGARSDGKSYKYLQSGGIQYRVNSHSGRTDALIGAGGWQPVSFDRAAEVIPSNDLTSFTLIGGTWDNSTGETCYEVANGSGYVLESIDVSMSVDVFRPPAKDRLLTQLIHLTQHGGGLLDRKTRSLFCGRNAARLPAGEEATLFGERVSFALGWKDE